MNDSKLSSEIHIEALLIEYESSRAHTERLCRPLRIEDYIPQPVEFVSPPKWHLAHTTWFFEEMILKKYLRGYKVYNPKFSFYFNSYYQSVGDRTKRAERGTITRPGVDEIYEYRRWVDLHIRLLMELNPPDELLDLLELGINHEEQHQELLMTDLKFTLSRNIAAPVYEPGFDLTSQRNDSSTAAWIKINEGVYQIGHNQNSFAFDNEKSAHRVFLEPFEISSQLVSNGEYLEFVEAGGYKNFSLWLDEAWTWLHENKIEHPLYWKKYDEHWYQYTLSGMVKLDPDAILAHISFYEAQAFATWKGMRLPTEFEWEAASDHLQWGSRWEWTYSAYLPYPGFEIAEGAVGEYNGKFMINQMVLRGASPATAPGHSRKTYRNFFHPQYQWQITGIRLAR